MSTVIRHTFSFQRRKYRRLVSFTENRSWQFEAIVLIIRFTWLFALFAYIIIIVFYGFLISSLPSPAIGLVYSCKLTYYKEQQYLNITRQCFSPWMVCFVSFLHKRERIKLLFESQRACTLEVLNIKIAPVKWNKHYSIMASFPLEKLEM